MFVRRLAVLALALLVGLGALMACGPYTSMTDQVPAQTRRAAALLPQSPRFVGMVDLQEAQKHVKKLNEMSLADTLRQSGSESLRTFLSATGMEPRTDIEAVYGAMEGQDGEGFSAVLFADLTTAQMDRFVEAAPEATRRTTYREVPLYHVRLGDVSTAEGADSLSLGVVNDGTIVLATNPERVRAAVDRDREERGRLQDNEKYMTLVERVGRGSTGWFVGRNVIKAALQDSSAGPEEASTLSPDESDRAVRQAGVQQVLVEWSNRVLGLSEVSSGVSSDMASGVASLGSNTEDKLRRLKDKVREQAISITLSSETVDGQVYLTMKDEDSAASVQEMAEGALAALRFSSDSLTEKQQDLLDDTKVTRDGPMVRATFSMSRDALPLEQPDGVTAVRSDAVHGADPATRPVNSTTHRASSIMRPLFL
jgi:hypothetical protein